MFTENQNDVPIRTVVTEKDGGWIAYCLDFAIEGQGSQPEEAVDRLEEAIQEHFQKVRAGQVPLFQQPSEEVWKLYVRAAEARLLATGPGHGHVEHRPLLLQSANV